MDGMNVVGDMSDPQEFMPQVASRRGDEEAVPTYPASAEKEKAEPTGKGGSSWPKSKGDFTTSAKHRGVSPVQRFEVVDLG